MVEPAGEGEPLRLDLRGLRCPLPVIRLESVLRRSAPGRRVDVLTDDPVARVDIPLAMRVGGHECRENSGGADYCVFEVTRAG